ncbi:ER membrane protein complex subunit 10 isoform X1 [Diorhabda carinulata]|uniref:ER membrane protein complex subunit 10 isoform X1 n=1 Tax=Diorhabda carinulata TaxID=1163345 RepID=UPI0025A07CED|nr:ER membrane protein complex subunit 10 isoform X1 [Diorhabda carinulata]
MNFNQILFTLISIFASTLASNLEHDGSVVIRLQHSLFFENSPIWTERGNITIQSLRLGQATVDQKALSIEEQKSLRDLAANNGFYQIRAIVTASDGSEKTFISTLKACMLAESELDDRLSVSIDYMGRVIGVTDVVASKSACEGAVVPLEKLKHFNTVVYVRHSETGPIPDTASYVQKLEREKEAKEKGETKDNRSFLAKYWMYIVPLLIFMAISSATNPEAQQAQ